MSKVERKVSSEAAAGKENYYEAQTKQARSLMKAVVVDGRNSTGNILIRDPYEATKYEMTVDEFVEYWNGRVVRRSGE